MTGIAMFLTGHYILNYDYWSGETVRKIYPALFLFKIISPMTAAVGICITVYGIFAYL